MCTLVHKVVFFRGPYVKSWQNKWQQQGNKFHEFREVDVKERYQIHHLYQCKWLCPAAFET
jgi:hypothetical protein